jgi:hypothetical protein
MAIPPVGYFNQDAAGRHPVRLEAKVLALLYEAAIGVERTAVGTDLGRTHERAGNRYANATSAAHL